MTSELYGYQILGRSAYDRSGRYLGRVADVVLDSDGRLADVVVSPRPWGRLLGYERDEVTGPRLLEVLARRALRRGTHRLPWSAVRIGDEAP
ncbi:MAG: hypothetical protein AUI14_06060 [Actinobacteria bacterium 13_2_20CM_2_71_6]|nr:MAG: hypothetical protein AUI14_06060 [Actinobacteria bacterium 13_2_20CM_2_71_6]